MARPAVKVKALCGKRLKQLIGEQKITQNELSKMIFISPQTISKIVNGTASLTEPVAWSIIDKFPEYRIEWLLGIDDFPTERSKSYQVYKKVERNKELLDAALLCFGELLDIKMELFPFKGTERRTVEEALEKVKTGFTFEFDGKKVCFGVDELSYIENEICDVVEAILKRFILERGK